MEKSGRVWGATICPERRPQKKQRKLKNNRLSVKSIYCPPSWLLMSPAHKTTSEEENEVLNPLSG